MKRTIAAAVAALAGAVALPCAAAAAPMRAPAISRSLVVVAQPAVARLGESASVVVRGFAGRGLEVRLVGATAPGGYAGGWMHLRVVGATWRGSLPRPTLRGIYPIELRAGGEVVRSASWLFRVFASGTLSRPSFATPEEVARWWVRTVPEHARLVALRRWQRPAFDRRDPRLHQLLVVAYAPDGHPAVSDRLGMFVTAVRDGFSGRWRLLEASVQP